ncbi:MAG: hypothetical protein PUJ15_06285, partial [Bacteroidaceae bacterium]|nr:hypothetical protein [Bacteroidaceae bacterium]
GIDIKVISDVPTGQKDEFGMPETYEQVLEFENVLVSPVSSEDMINELNLTGRKIVYQLALPKEYDDYIESGFFKNGTKVEVFGEKYKMVGEPTRGIESLIPLDWNAKVKVERIE